MRPFLPLSPCYPFLKCHWLPGPEHLVKHGKHWNRVRSMSLSATTGQVAGTPSWLISPLCCLPALLGPSGELGMQAPCRGTSCAVTTVLVMGSACHPFFLFCCSQTHLQLYHLPDSHPVPLRFVMTGLYHPIYFMGGGDGMLGKPVHPACTRLNMGPYQRPWEQTDWNPERTILLTLSLSHTEGMI